MSLEKIKHKHKGRLLSLYVFWFRCLLINGLFYSFGQAEAQRFYIGGLDQFLLSSYQYSLTYQNYPTVFNYRDRLSDGLPTNFTYYLGYQFREKHFVELSYSKQDYAFFKDFKENIFLARISEEKAINVGLRYKFSLLNFPLRVLAFEGKYPFRLMTTAGVVYRINANQIGTGGGSYSDNLGQLEIEFEELHTNNPQALFQAGLEAEFPLYRSLCLVANYIWFFGFGQDFLTTAYTDFTNGGAKGYRHSDGGGAYTSISLRWYLPGGTDRAQPVSLISGRKIYLGLEYFQFSNSNRDPRVSPIGLNESIGIIAGYRKHKNILETGITPLPSLLGYETSLPLAGASSHERRWYMPIRYKRAVPFFKKGQHQNLEWLPSAGVGLHLPVILTSDATNFPDGDLASNHQRVNALALGAEVGSELAINAGGLSLSLQLRYLHGFAPTRQLQLFNNNGMPTNDYVSSTPTGWLSGISVKYRLGR